MHRIETTAFDIAQRFIGVKEVDGTMANPQIMAMLRLDAQWPEGDETPWCSAFVNYVAWLLRLPRSKSLLARSWLQMGRPVPLTAGEPAFDVVVLKRGEGEQPGPENVSAPGHVGFFAGIEGQVVLVLGGNQSNAVNIGRFPMSRVLGLRRLIF